MGDRHEELIGLFLMYLYLYIVRKFKREKLQSEALLTLQITLLHGMTAVAHSPVQLANVYFSAV